MAKKGNRIQVILECTEHKDSGMPGTSRYISTKNKKNTPDRLELKKFNPVPEVVGHSLCDTFKLKYRGFPAIEFVVPFLSPVDAHGTLSSLL